MNKNISIILLVTLLLSGCLTSERDSRKKELLQDLNQLSKAIDKHHPKTFTDEVKLNELIENKKKKISSMSEYEFYKYIAPIIAEINCGHTSIDYSEEEKNTSKFNSSFIPLDLRVIKDKFYVYYDHSNQGITRGSLILSINYMDSSDLLSTLYSSMSSDGRNKTMKDLALNKTFGNLYYSYIDSPKEFVIKYIEPDSNEIKKVVLKGKTKPIDNRRWGTFKTDFNDKFALLKVGSFNYYTDKDIASFNDSLENFFKELKRIKMNNLVLDLRGNYGGAAEPGNELLSYILKKPFQYFADDTPYYDNFVKDTSIKGDSYKGNLYVLIDGDCFSTTGHVLSHIKSRKRGVIIGSESGGSFICNDGTQPLTLKNSGIVVNLPRMIFKTSVNSLPLGEGIKPDIEVSYTIDDLINRKDLEMDEVLNLI